MMEKSLKYLTDIKIAIEFIQEFINEEIQTIINQTQ